MKIWSICFGLLLCIIGVNIWRDARRIASPHCAVIHMPRSGVCPAGYTKERAPRFTEKDGSKEFGCASMDPSKQGCVDELRSGEQMEILLPMPLPEDEPEGKPRT